MSTSVHSKAIDIFTIIFTSFSIAVFFNISTWIVGHFLNFQLKDFCIGVGPELFRKTFGGSDFAIRAFPFGGSINFNQITDYGIELLELHKLKVHDRILITVAGPLLNLGIGLALLPRQSRRLSIISLISIWYALLSIIPLPFSNNGFILITGLIPSISHKPYNDILPHTLQILTVFLLFFMNLGLIVYFAINTDKILNMFNSLKLHLTKYFFALRD